MAEIDDFQALLNNPEKLLRRYVVNIGGLNDPAPQNGAAVKRRFSVAYYNQTASGFTTGISGFFGRKKNRPIIRLQLQDALPNGDPNPPGELDAYYIPMVQVADVANQCSHYTLPSPPPVGEPTLALTSQLTACRFAVGSDATGATLVTHVQPDQSAAVAPNQTQEQIRQARQANLQTIVNNNTNARRGSFALDRDYTDNAAVIGHYTNAGWHFYIQDFSLATPRRLNRVTRM